VVTVNDSVVRGPVTLKLGTPTPAQSSPFNPVVCAKVIKPEPYSSENKTDRIADVVRTYCVVYVENCGPTRCLADSGTELSIAKRSAIDRVNSSGVGWSN